MCKLMDTRARVGRSSCFFFRPSCACGVVTFGILGQIIPETSPESAMVLEKEYQACRQETWALFQVTPETLESYVDTLKLYTSNTSLWRLDERKFLNTDATLVKSLSQLNLAVS